MRFFKNFMDKKNKILITHNGSFHADDVFACATLSLILEKQGQEFEIIRTRDEEVINSGDYVFDVGGIYDPELNRFDHHQKGGAGRRAPNGAEGENDIEYSSFGLVWKKFGKELCGLEEVAKILDQKLVAPIDAFDNGFDLVENKYEVTPYYIQHFFMVMHPATKEKHVNNDEMFFKSVKIAREILLREIIHAEDTVLMEEILDQIYKNTENKKILVLTEDFHEAILTKYPELLFVVYPKKTDGHWGVRAVRENPKTFKNRKDFPESWAGLRDEELQKITGVEDAVFCHKARFLTIAKNKEAAVKLAELALQA